MAIYWNIKDRAAAKGWENAHQLAKAAGLSYPVAWRILQGEPIERIETATLETLARVFGVKPFSLLEHREGKR